VRKAPFLLSALNLDNLVGIEIFGLGSFGKNTHLKNMWQQVALMMLRGASNRPKIVYNIPHTFIFLWK